MSVRDTWIEKRSAEQLEAVRSVMVQTGGYVSQLYRTSFKATSNREVFPNLAGVVVNQMYLEKKVYKRIRRQEECKVRKIQRMFNVFDLKKRRARNGELWIFENEDCCDEERQELICLPRGRRVGIGGNFE
jgi:hypothetical protein